MCGQFHPGTTLPPSLPLIQSHIYCGQFCRTKMLSTRVDPLASFLGSVSRSSRLALASQAPNFAQTSSLTLTNVTHYLRCSPIYVTNLPLLSCLRYTRSTSPPNCRCSLIDLSLSSFSFASDLLSLRIAMTIFNMSAKRGHQPHQGSSPVCALAPKRVGKKRHARQSLGG